MERRITFKQCYVRVIKREADGRRMSVSEDLMAMEEEVEEELQIRVTNQEKNSVVMWDVQQFQDRLEMLRDTLN